MHKANQLGADSVSPNEHRVRASNALAARPNASDSVTELSSLGLTTYEARAYLALVRLHASTASDVARLASLPRQRIYDVLDSLIDKGLAATRPGRVARYAATPPERGLERLLARRREQLLASQQAASALLDVLRPVYERGRKHAEQLPYLEVLPGRAAAVERVAELQGGAQRELLVFAKPPFEQILVANVTRAVTKHCEVRSIHELSALERGDALDTARTRREARYVRQLPLPLVVADEATLALSVDDPRGGDAGDATTLVAAHPALARICKLAFEAVWEHAVTAEHARPARASVA